MNDHAILPIRAGKVEQVKLNAEKSSLYQQHQKLKDEVKEIETIQRSVKQITRENKPKQNWTKPRNSN